MDKRIPFALVFLFTLFSTVSVALVCWFTSQGFLRSALYAMVTMWITGIISQLLFHSIYLNIVKPLEEQKKRDSKEYIEDERPLDLHSLEKIEDVEGQQASQVEREEEGPSAGTA